MTTLSILIRISNLEIIIMNIFCCSLQTMGEDLK